MGERAIATTGNWIGQGGMPLAIEHTLVGTGRGTNKVVSDLDVGANVSTGQSCEMWGKGNRSRWGI